MPSPIHRLSKKLDQLTVYVNEVFDIFISVFSQYHFLCLALLCR